MEEPIIYAKYGEPGRQHHIWCNFAMLSGPCKVCDRLFKSYPYTGEPPADLVKTHFPNVIER